MISPPFGPHASFQRIPGLAWSGIAAALAVVACCSSAYAQNSPIVSRGDAAVTSFAGIAVPLKAPKDVNPIDVTLIDTAKPTLQIFDLSKLGGAGANQLANAPVKFEAKASDIGHVFGVTFDSPASGAAPNVYAGATSLFGLQIVERAKDGSLIRLVEGSARAQWMPGQFGLSNGGGPGSIWKIDGQTGAITLFSNITSGNLENAGPGLAGLSFDPVSQSVYAANLETGLIHQLDRNGREISTFDHGVSARAKAGLPDIADDPNKRMDIKSPSFNVEDAATWGYADKKRRVLALGVESGRLYYSVAEGPVIWSVGLNDDGSFADDARLEVDVTGTPNNSAITALAFDGPGTLYVTQRGELTGSYDYSTLARPQTSVVSRYVWNANKKEWKNEREEFAIGLESIHRATNGGVALGYGYDSNGNIDFGKCQQTLWVTGENLRSGAGSEATVDGLQGIDKSQSQTPLVSPARSGATALQADFTQPADSGLEPPKNAWFTDKDGKTEGPRQHAHVGAIEIYAPCGKMAANEPKRPMVPPFVPGKPHVGPGIFIDKQCYPSPFGGKVRCEISLINIGTTPLWPVSFTDVSSILFGPGAGATISIESATTDGPDFICSPTPAPALSCWLPAFSLPPGTTRKVELWVDTGPLLAGGNSGFINCARLDAPHHGIACDEGGAEIVVEKTAPAACMPGAPCTFGLKVTNKGSFPFEGHVLLTDAMFVGGAGVAAPITSIAPGIGCDGGDPVALPFSCNVMMSLAPGVPISFAITVTMPAAPPNYWAQNCFVASNPLLPAPALPGGVGSPASCAWVPVGAPAPLSNLRIEKSAGACGKTGPLNVRCEYAIKVTNTGPSPFSDFITLDETVSATATLASLDPALVCIPGGGGHNTCNTVAAVNLIAGQSVTFPVAVDTPKLDIDANLCKAPNTVKITAPLGPDKNFNPADDTATATGDAALIEFFDPITGLTLVLCDPTNLKTTKVANGVCVKSGSYHECGYKITVTNMGPDPYKGPINIKDELSGASSATFSGGWNCSGAGSTYECTKGPLDMAKGATVTLDVKAKFPDSGQCVARNRATMTFPLPGTRYNLSGADDSATATSSISSPKCDEKPVCESPGPGEFRSRSGACACLPGYTRDRSGTCKPETGPVTGPEPSPEISTCPGGNPVPRNGVCPCPSGTAWNKENKTCEAVCEPGPNEYRTSSGQCICKSGYLRSEGKCIAIEEVTPPVIDEGCTPGPNEYENSKGRCVCKRGFERIDGRCVEPLTPSEECKLRGWIWTGRRCVEPVNPAEECRKKGWVWTGIKCVPGIVIDPVSPAQGCRKKGWTWNGTKCVEPTSPAEECKRKGWNWTGSKCIEPLSPAQECKKKGWLWTGKICVKLPVVEPTNPAVECRKKGWIWNGKTCTAPPSPAEECNKKGWLWTGKTCVKPPVIEPKRCPSGTIGKYPNCKKIEIIVPKKSDTPPDVQKQKLNLKQLDPKKLNLGKQVAKRAEPVRTK